jgi:hypothetical protein
MKELNIHGAEGKVLSWCVAGGQDSKELGPEWTDLNVGRRAIRRTVEQCAMAVKSR